MSVLGFLMLAFNGMRHIIATVHRQPFNTATSDIFILAVRPSYMFTSFPSYIDMYSSLETNLALSSVFCTSSGSISMVLAGSRTLCSNFSTLVDFSVVPLGIWKNLLELSLVMMKRSPCCPEIDVERVSLIVGGIVPFRTPILTSTSVRGEGLFLIFLFLLYFLSSCLLFLSW